MDLILAIATTALADELKEVSSGTQEENGHPQSKMSPHPLSDSTPSGVLASAGRLSE